MSEGSGVGSLSWTLADDKGFLCILEVGRHERKTERAEKRLLCGGHRFGGKQLKKKNMRRNGKNGQVGGSQSGGQEDLIRRCCGR